MGLKLASRVRGLSDAAFGEEDQCRAALFRLRWPEGFVCPACGHRGYCIPVRRRLYQCNRCKTQTSLTAASSSQLAVSARRPVSRFPGTASGACVRFADSPWSRPFTRYPSTS